MTSVRIRPARPDDEAAVGRVAYATGFFGESAARYFPARTLFTQLWVGPYFHGAGEGCFVAERDGQVVGYVLGSADPAAYRRALVGAALSTWRRPEWGALRRSLPYLGRALRFPAPHASAAQYPAHLHLNVLPGVRGMRIGERLLRAHLSALDCAGVRGVQLSTTTENVAALGLYRKLGFQEVAARVTPLWTPWLGRPAQHVLMVRDAPGAGER